jgi:RimJ/RimL family protein N-acetyltransferase
MDDTTDWTLDDALAYGGDLLQGERVALRESREADFERLARWWVDPAVGIFQTGYVRPTPAPTVSDVMRGWGSNVGSDAGFTIITNQGGVGASGDGDKSGAEGDSDRVIGQISLFGVTKNRCGTLGIVLGRDYWGDGLGTEAVRLMIRYGFLEMGLHRVQLGVYAYNERAIRSYARAGFREEARRAEVAFHGGRWHDEVLMAILEDDWHASHP